MSKEMAMKLQLDEATAELERKHQEEQDRLAEMRRKAAQEFGEKERAFRFGGCYSDCTVSARRGLIGANALLLCERSLAIEVYVSSSVLGLCLVPF